MAQRTKYGLQLKRWRERKGLSQMECAKSVGGSQTEWSAWERGQFWPTPVLGFRVERLTGVKYEWAAEEKGRVESGGGPLFRKVKR